MNAVDQKFECPVCHYRGMTEEPVNEAICFCCGTQFGFDDYERTHDELRHEWLMKGAPWFAEWNGHPRGWSARAQMKSSGIPLTREEEQAIALQYLAAEDVVTTQGFAIFIELNIETRKGTSLKPCFGAGETFSERLEIHSSKVGRDASSFAVCGVS